VTDRKRRPTLHLVRHGQSTWNLEHRVQGQQDAPVLTELGRRQAADVAATLAGSGAGLLLTSDLTRAVQTAEIIGSATGLPPIQTALLREQGLGSLEGLTTRQATAALAGVDLTDPATRYGAAESREDVAARIETLLTGPLLANAATAGGAILVTHGDTIRIAIAHLLAEDLAVAPWREIANGSVTTLRGPGRGPAVAR
jgi:probable phosphoglycerate mutase